MDLQDLPVEHLGDGQLHAAAILRSRGYGTVGSPWGTCRGATSTCASATNWRRVRHGAPGTVVALEAVVEDARWAGRPGARRLMLALKEPRGVTVVRAVFFNAKPGMGTRSPPGALVRVVGTLRAGPQGPELVHPRILAPSTRTNPIEPIYAGIGALAPGTIARIVASAVERAGEWPTRCLPPSPAPSGSPAQGTPCAPSTCPRRGPADLRSRRSWKVGARGTVALASKSSWRSTWPWSGRGVDPWAGRGPCPRT